MLRPALDKKEGKEMKKMFIRSFDSREVQPSENIVVHATPTRNSYHQAGRQAGNLKKIFISLKKVYLQRNNIYLCRYFLSFALDKMKDVKRKKIVFPKI